MGPAVDLRNIAGSTSGDSTVVEPKPQRDEQVVVEPGEHRHGETSEVKKMLEALTKPMESGEKKIEANDKKVEMYNSRVIQIPGAPPILKGSDSKKFIQKPFPPSAAPKLIPKRVDHMGNGSGYLPIRNEKRNDRGPSGRGLMRKGGFGRSLVSREAPRLSEYNFNVDVASIVSAIGRIKETKWPRPLQSNPAQRDPNLMCKYHGTHGHRTEYCRQLREEVA
uniref:Uncharacterized protein n=1 Tax=Nicotiana tabacum TaxID=4097 RepID=A0A1S4CPY8_TOBAC|nr:PREDICTED: uncharacterized protein LOC107821222 [Nicotiana tabacum]